MALIFIACFFNSLSVLSRCDITMKNCILNVITILQLYLKNFVQWSIYKYNFTSRWSFKVKVFFCLVQWYLNNVSSTQEKTEKWKLYKIYSALEKALLKMSFCNKMFDWFSIYYLANPFLKPPLTILYEERFLIEILDYNTATQFVPCYLYT